MSKVYSTLDCYIAGYLVLKGFVPSLEAQDNGSKIVFVFPATEKLHKEISKYNNGEMVEALHLAVTIKNLKSRIFSLKKSNRYEIYA